MKFYLDNIPLGDVPEPECQPGEFFPRLVGVAVRSANAVSGAGKYNNMDVEPIYIPLLRVQRRAGQIWVEINSDRPLFYITLQRRRPFFNIFRFEWEREQ
jgi:hypothetical protein